MDIKDKFYKIDKKTGENRISKFKVGIVAIILIFLMFFILASLMSIGTTENGNYPINDYGNTNSETGSYFSKPTISEAEYKGSTDETSFKKLNKNPNSRIGENYTFSGQVFDVKEEGNQTRLQLLIGYDRIWVTYDGKIDVYDGDYITIWGQVMGSHSYTSVDNSQWTLPWIHAWFIE